MGAPIVVIGAGLAGLACARTLQQAGREVQLLERSRKPGGRCATRLVAGQPIDHGPAFLHGSDPRFVEAARAAGMVSTGWPKWVRGSGPPCHPSSFRPGETRFTHPGGLNAFPQWLARGLDVRFDHEVRELRRRGSAFELDLISQPALTTPHLVLALAAPQATALLRPLAVPLRALRGVLRLLDEMGTVPCVTLLALYAKGTIPYDLDLVYPEDSQVLQLIAVDSSKRLAPAHDALVLQARPAWTRANLALETTWRRKMLEEAAGLLGPWALQTIAEQTHRWKYARTWSGTELSAPFLHAFRGDFLGLCGDAFAFGGGAQGAYLSGVSLAERILAPLPPSRRNRQRGAIG